MKYTIAEHMRDILIENNTNTVWYGCLDEIHECAVRSGMYDRVRGKFGSHPLNINSKVLSALSRSDLFEEYRIKHIGRPARSFKLIEEHETETVSKLAHNKGEQNE
ncbi:hypothetical protein G7059_00165 [Erysipelothrix sp. HDW6A]|uniref:hypothetical protein n=1 Tax=Erysipelothrix sp. HDW6A TaxID=2714928 RepID=UPI001407C1F2|nr:hypothetical protein [Erysipelothrix sp. HDW6A]QIK56369.1 hypothetical protein G7059_00165 [Erysipelothrix sp. HDW6A]